MAGTEMISQDLLRDTKRLSAVGDYLPIVASAFSRAARSAARATGMPFSLVCILDGEHIHFKGTYGLELSHNKRPLPDNVSLLIPERFTQTNQPEALGALNQLFASRSGWQKHFFAFQAAVPLRGADGHVLGALVVLDEQIRELDVRDVAMLEDCAEALVAELDLRRQIAALEVRRTPIADLESSGFQPAESQPVESEQLKSEQPKSEYPDVQPSETALEAADAAPLEQQATESHSSSEQVSSNQLQSDQFLENQFHNDHFPEDHFHPSRIADSSPLALIAETLDGTITYWNAAAERLLGYTPEGILGQSSHSIIPSGRVDLPPDDVELLHAGDFVTSTTQTARLHRDGRELAVRASFAAIKDAHGNVVGISSALEAATAPAALAAATLSAANVTAANGTALPALVFSIDIDGFFTACEGAPLLETLGDHKQVIGQTCFRVLESEQALLEAICVGLLGEEFEFGFQSSLGKPRRAYVHPMFEAGLPTGVFGVIVPTR